MSGGAETCGKPQEAKMGREGHVGVLLVVQGRGNGCQTSELKMKGWVDLRYNLELDLLVDCALGVRESGIKEYS